jgi:hypothetical protein
MTLTQTERVILAAKSYRGVCAVDFLAPEVIDQGKPIARLAARIFDAENKGHVFEIIGWRNKTKVYRWVEGPDVESDSGASAPTAPVETDLSLSAVALSTGTLFEVPARSHYDETP